MSDTTVPTPGQAAGTAPGSAPVPEQSVTTPAGEGTETPGQEGAEGKFITREEAAKLREDILNQARSYSDKGRVRVERAVEAVTYSVANLRALGQEITPDQEKAFQDAAVRKAMTEPEPVPAGQQPPQAEPQGPIDPEILAIQKDTGIELYDGDPELAAIDRSRGRRKFYQSIESACSAKKTRLASPTEPIQPISPASRVPAGGGPSSPNQSGRDYLQEAHKRTSHT